MKHDVIPLPDVGDLLDFPHIVERVAAVSARPRYTMLVLGLINGIAGEKGRAGPWVRAGDGLVSVREWLCDAIMPMAARSRRRTALVEQIRDLLASDGRLPQDSDEAERIIDGEVRERVRSSGMTNVSRAVSDLVKAGLLERHYQGYRVDHDNRGAQRHVVYTVPAAVRTALTTGRSGCRVGTLPRSSSDEHYDLYDRL